VGYNLCESYLKRGTPFEVRLKQVDVAWGVWALNDVSQTVLDVRRTPHSISRPSSNKESSYDKGESVSSVRSGMFSTGSHVHVGDGFKNQLKKNKINTAI